MGGRTYGTPGMARAVTNLSQRWSCLHCEWTLVCTATERGATDAFVDVAVLHVAVFHPESGWSPEETERAKVHAYRDARTLRNVR
jgi:hypothetical protein